ncbi:MAG: dipicolinate synthase subunit B [Erysipelotrichaceae bacterium]|nr:dipicolinate synthase subunit B [Erysipelotrichaceae bacterium]
MKLLWGICGSFCNHPKILDYLYKEAQKNEWDLQFVISENCASCDTRFGTKEYLIKTLEDISHKKVFSSIVQAETVGPYSDFEAMVIAPCTASCLSHLACGNYDHSVSLCAKAMLRNEKPIVLAIASNDILSLSSCNLFTLLQHKNIYVVPFYQDDPIKKPNSCISDFDLILPALQNALKGKQLQPLFANRNQTL